MPQLFQIPYVTAELYYLAFTIEFSVNSFTLPKVLLDNSCYSFYNESSCELMAHNVWDTESTKVHDMAAKYSMYNQISAVLPAISTLLLWGALADRIGKRKVMMVPPILLALQNILYAILTKYKFHPKYFIPVGLIRGLYGDFSGITMMTASYMATSTRRSTRTLRFSIVEGCIYISFIPAIVIAGVMAVYAGTYATYVLNAVLGILAFLYTIFLLPPPSHLAAENIDDHQVEAIKHDTDTGLYKSLRGLLLSFKDVYITIIGNGFLNLFLLSLIVVCLFVIATNSEIDVATLFYRGKPLYFSTISFAFAICATGFVRGIGVIIVTQIGIRYFKASDLQLVIIGGTCKAITIAAIALVSTQYAIWIINCFVWAVSVPVPALRSMISKLVDDSHHGTVLSIFALVDTISSFVASVTSNSAYRVALTSVHGLPFLMISGICLLATSIALLIYYRYDYIAVERSIDADENESNKFLLENNED